jgi:hypothetical protein
LLLTEYNCVDVLDEVMDSEMKWLDLEKRRSVGELQPAKIRPRCALCSRQLL